MDPYDFSCPTCQAPPQYNCATRSGSKAAKPHASRRARANGTDIDEIVEGINKYEQARHRIASFVARDVKEDIAKETRALLLQTEHAINAGDLETAKVGLERVKARFQALGIGWARSRPNPVNTRMAHIAKTVSPAGQAAALRTILYHLDPERPRRGKNRRMWLAALRLDDLATLQARAEALPGWASKQPWDKLLPWYAQQVAKAAKARDKGHAPEKTQEEQARQVDHLARLRELAARLDETPGVGVDARLARDLRNRLQRILDPRRSRPQALEHPTGIELPIIAEWIADTGIQVNKMQPRAASREANTWKSAETLRLAEKKAAEDINTTAVQEQTHEVWRSPTNWYAVQLTGTEACTTEGGRMHHCLRDVANSEEIYSLRDRFGKSRVTIRVMGGRVSDALGFANESPRGGLARITRQFIHEYIGDDDY